LLVKLNKDQKGRAAVGRAGEYFALARLSLAGYICTLCQIEDHDAYIQTDTQILTLQIKTASKSHKTARSYAFHTPKKNVGVSDVFAFVAIDLGAVCRKSLQMKSCRCRKRSTALNSALWSRYYFCYNV